MDFHLSNILVTVLALLAVWELAWKGIALWRAGRNNQKNWFIAILIINSVGVLPIVYLLSQKHENSKVYER